MRVHVDKARRHDLARGVDFLRAAHIVQPPMAAILSPATARSASKRAEPSPEINVAWRMTRS